MAKELIKPVTIGPWFNVSKTEAGGNGIQVLYDFVVDDHDKLLGKVALPGTL